MKLKEVFDIIVKCDLQPDPHDAHLLLAICLVESSLIPEATRLEPQWKYFFEPKLFSNILCITEMTERMHQSTSWGLVQIMGSVARELGYKDHLVKLIDPVINIKYGLLKISQLKKRYQNIKDVISAYNVGNPVVNVHTKKYINENYVQNVYSHFTQFVNDIK